MPIFEYRCSACHVLEELLQRASDPAPSTCPKCGADGTMHKELSLSSFALKGGGWYKDLYASTSPAAGGAAGSGGDASVTSPAVASTPAADTKAAATPAAAPATPATTTPTTSST